MTDAVEAIARALDPEIWGTAIPVERAGVEDFYRRRQQSCEKARAVLKSLAENGYVVVPREPTPEMIAAGCDRVGSTQYAETVYWAMIEASKHE